MVDTRNPVIEFTALDRCDRCGAQALALAQREDQKSEILFCAHHLREHKDFLLDSGWEIVCDNAALDKLGITLEIPVA